MGNFAGGPVIKNPLAKTGTASLIPLSGGYPGERNDCPLQYSCLGNPMDRGTWQTTVHGVIKESEMTQQLNNNNAEMNSLKMHGSLKSQILFTIIKTN